MELATRKRSRHVEHEFTDDESFRLIAAVEKQRCLWDVMDKTYKNRSHNRSAWQLVADEVRLPQEVVIGKWSLLRQRFRNAYAKLKETGQANHQHPDRPPPNIFYTAMLFLAPTLETMRAIRKPPKQKKIPPQFEFSSLSYSDDDGPDVDDSSFQQAPSVSSPPPPTKRGRSSRRISNRGSTSFPSPSPKLEMPSHSDNERAESAFHHTLLPPPPPPPPPPQHQATASTTSSRRDDRDSLMLRLSRWIDEDMGSKRTRPNKYESLTAYVCNLMCNHPNRRLADEVAVEISKLATRLIRDS